ncbi:transmembrane protein 258-like [Oppia nitens]|uniref:transmembrane protein 258-like n=1 Tax=Oppia nitens TaxID=1686743 RepID=UPI0023DAAF10|nr:transmembrane protein 258-like [Oppia nitens]
MLDNLSSLSSYEPFISSTVYPHLSLLFLSIGVLFMAWFFTLEVTTKSSSTLLKELTTSLIGSTFIGFGTVFLLLWVGIYV